MRAADGRMKVAGLEKDLGILRRRIFGAGVDEVKRTANEFVDDIDSRPLRSGIFERALGRDFRRRGVKSRAPPDERP